MPRMSERRPRGRNGAAKRYKGPRELVGTRVPPEITGQIDEEREALGLTRNDYLFAAILMALEDPKTVQATAAKLTDQLTRALPSQDQLRLADEALQEEVLRQTA